jgi:ankyrin repeat protein
MDPVFTHKIPEYYQETAYELIAHGVYNPPDLVHGDNMLTIAAKKGHLGIVSSLCIDFQWNVDNVNRQGITALYAACEANQQTVVDTLLYYGAKPSLQMGDRQWTPLMLSSALGYLSLVKTLVARMTNDELNAMSPRYNETAVFCAAVHGHASCLEYLLQHGGTKRIWSRNKTGLTPLAAAVKGGHTCVVNLILSFGESWERSKELSEALFVAVYFDRYHMAKLLLKRGARCIHTMAGGSSPLMLAVAKANVDMVTLCVNHAYLHTDYDISVPILFAKWIKSAVIVERLLTLIQPQHVISDPYVLLDMAVWKGHTFLVASFLKLLEIDLNKRDENQRTLLYRLACMGDEYEKCTHLVLQYGADPYLMDSQGITPMYKAASLNHLKTVTRFLDAGVDINCTRHPNQLTALYMASCAGHHQMVKLLLDAGAWPTMKTPPHLPHRNAYDAAKALGHVQCTEHIEHYLWKEQERVVMLRKARILHDLHNAARQSPKKLPRINIDVTTSKEIMGGIVQHVVFGCFSDNVFQELLTYMA